MTLYTRHQLLLVLFLVGAAGAGLAVDHWRRARPDLAARLEGLDRTQRAVTPAEPGGARRSLRPAPDARHDSPARSGRAGAWPADDPAPASTAPVDVNRASEVELAGLPGIGPALASRIVAARPFTEIEELRRVRGLRRGTLERLRPLVTAGASGPPDR
jgi:DNA uptake protein ComE-like DNA-binding protein